MFSSLIVDDEPLAREILSNYIEESESLQLASSFGNAADALQYLKEHSVDILFLDIEMPGINGIDFLRSLSHPPITVFTTAFRDYAFEGFELGVIDFLLKPISQTRFTQAIEKINDFLSLKKTETDLEINKETPEFMFVKSGVQKIKVFFSEITHIQGLKDYAIIHADSGRIVTKGSIKFMQELFHAHSFLRVHKSFIVSKNRISRITSNKLVIGNHHIPIGRSYKEELEQALANVTKKK